jgi:hypothetical protein
MCRRNPNINCSDRNKLQLSRLRGPDSMDSTYSAVHRHGSATSTVSSSSNTFGQAPRDYIDCLFVAQLFRHRHLNRPSRLGSARLHQQCQPDVACLHRLCSLHDLLQQTTPSHLINEAKCSFFKSQLLFTFATPKIPGGCAITSLPQIYSGTWWISFLRLSGIIFSGIYHPSAQWNISFFGSVDISSSALDTSFSAHWI